MSVNKDITDYNICRKNSIILTVITAMSVDYYRKNVENSRLKGLKSKDVLKVVNKLLKSSRLRVSMKYLYDHVTNQLNFHTYSYHYNSKKNEIHFVRIPEDVISLICK